MNAGLINCCQGAAGQTKGKSRLQVVDSLGIFASLLCLVHCLALPILLALIPAMAIHGDHGHCHSHASNDLTHVLLAGFVFLFCIVAIVPGYRVHGNSKVLFLMSVGLMAVLTATFHSVVGIQEAMELPLITFGNLMVMASHFWNRKLSKTIA